MKLFTLTVLLLAVFTFTACSQKSVEYGASGAVTGAVGSGLLGAFTDLIVDGKVNPYRLKRNMVAGGLVGGTTGAIVGQKKNENTKKQTTPTATTEKVLRTEIGEHNYAGLKSLIVCKHNEAYRMTLEALKSSNTDYQLAAYAQQALIDKDRNNTTGMTHALNNFIALDEEISLLSVAEEELNKLYEKLQDERRIVGRNISCR